MASKAKALKADPVRSQFEKYDIVDMRREDIKGAPYNPRIISERAKKSLKKNLGTVGLLAPIIVNRTTGNIVSGHQRINTLDALEKSYNYLVRVALVDLDEKTEKEQNIFMNNSEAMGDFDVESLESMLKDDEININATGFDESDIYKIFGEKVMSDDDLAEMSNKLHAMRDGFDKIKAKADNRDSNDFYLVVVFKSYDERRAFTDKYDFEDNRYIDGRAIGALIENPPDDVPGE